MSHFTTAFSQICQQEGLDFPLHTTIQGNYEISSSPKLEGFELLESKKPGQPDYILQAKLNGEGIWYASVNYKDYKIMNLYKFARQLVDVIKRKTNPEQGIQSNRFSKEIFSQMIEEDLEKEKPDEKVASRLSLGFENFNNWVLREITTQFADESFINEYFSRLNFLKDTVNSYNDKFIRENIPPLLIQLEEMAPGEKQVLDRYWKANINEIIRKIRVYLDQHEVFLNKPKKPKDPEKIKKLELALKKLSHVALTVKDNPGHVESAWNNFMSYIKTTKNMFLNSKFDQVNSKLMPLIMKYSISSEEGKTAIQSQMLRLINPQVFSMRSYVDKLRSQSTTVSYIYKKEVYAGIYSLVKKVFADDLREELKERFGPELPDNIIIKILREHGQTGEDYGLDGGSNKVDDLMDWLGY